MENQNNSWSEPEDPQWFDMGLSIGPAEVEQNPYHSDLLEACVIRRVSGKVVDGYGWNPYGLPSLELNVTGRALVGLNIYDVQQWSILTDELEKLYFKLKIYACDDLEAEYRVTHQSDTFGFPLYQNGG